jgi:PPM family protein phosphatase
MSDRIPSLRWSGHTETGRRANNEDSFLALTFDAQETRYLGKVGEAETGHQDFVFAVSDGMGGEKSGEFASKFATERITRLLPQHYRRRGILLQPLMLELVQRIHQDIVQLGRSYEECRRMGTTLTMAWLSGDQLRLAHVGDSRLYLLRDGKLQQLTEDHSFVGYLFRIGELNERQARSHPRRNVLSRALGSGQQFVDPQTHELGLEPGDRLLLCSDGISDGLWHHSLTEALQGGITAPELVKLAITEGSKDNCTAVIMDCR